MYNTNNIDTDLLIDNCIVNKNYDTIMTMARENKDFFTQKQYVKIFNSGYTDIMHYMKPCNEILNALMNNKTYKLNHIEEYINNNNIKTSGQNIDTFVNNERWFNWDHYWKGIKLLGEKLDGSSPTERTIQRLLCQKGGGNLYKESEDAINAVVSNIKLTERIFEICARQSHDCLKIMIDAGVLTSKHFNWCIKYLNYNEMQHNGFNVYTYLEKKENIKFNYILTEETILEMCKINNIYLLSLDCIKFNTKHLEYACYNGNIDLLKTILDRKIIPNDDCMIALIIGKSFTIKKLKLLIAFGGILTQKIVRYSIKEKRNLSEIFETCGIVLDENIYNYCHEFNYWPESYKFQINKKLIQLRYYSGTRTLKEIKDYVTNNKMELDSYCLDNACRMNSIEVVKYLLNNGVKPTLLTLKIAFERSHDNISNLIYGHIQQYKIKKPKDNFYLDYVNRIEKYSLNN